MPDKVRGRWLWRSTNCLCPGLRSQVPGDAHSDGTCQVKKIPCQKTAVSRQLAPQVCHLPSKVSSNCKICFWKGFFYYSCHNSDMLSRDKEQDKHDVYPKDKWLSNFPPATKHWQQTQILSRWYICDTPSHILNPNKSVIFTAITMLG